jgi:hypothetical protein
VAATLFICNVFLKERHRHVQANVRIRFRFRLVNTGPRTTSARRRPSAAHSNSSTGTITRGGDLTL